MHGAPALPARPRVVVVGAGFGGLAATRALAHLPVDVTLVDRHNYHLFQPLLYQVATSLLDPAEIAHPARALVRRHRNCSFRLAEVREVDLEGRRLLTDNGDLPYDHLIVAAGSVNNFFGDSSVAERAFCLKSLGEALALRNRILGAFEEASRTADAAERRRLLAFVLVGAGATGVELSGALSELVARVLSRDFPSLDTSEVSITIVEAGEHPLQAFAPSLRRAAARTLERKGVRLLFGAQVAGVDERGVSLRDGRRLEAATVVWTAGVCAAPLAASLAQARGRQDRVPVDSRLRLPGHPEVYVIGDLAEARQQGTVLPMLAPVAIQGAQHAARCIEADLQGRAAPEFHYRDKGTMAVVGRNSGIAQIGPLHLSGFPGWLTWLFVHLILLVGFRSKLVTLVNWGWDYVFYDRPVRLITGPSRLDDPGTPR